MIGSYSCILKQGTNEKHLTSLGFVRTENMLYYCKMMEGNLSLSIIFYDPIHSSCTIGKVYILDEEYGKLYDDRWNYFSDKHYKFLLKKAIEDLPIELILSS